MRLELENDLIAKYPTLFANRELQGSPMMFGWLYTSCDDCEALR